MKEFVDEAAKIVVEDNNPDRLFILVCIIGAAFILTMLLCIRANKKRVRSLKQTRKKIDKRHGLIQYENEQRALKQKNGKQDKPGALWKQFPL